MPSQEKLPVVSQEKPRIVRSESMMTSVRVEVAKLIREDAAADDRTVSYIIAKTLDAHYAPRLKSNVVVRPQLRRAA